MAQAFFLSHYEGRRKTLEGSIYRAEYSLFNGSEKG